MRPAERPRSWGRGRTAGRGAAGRDGVGRAAAGRAAAGPGAAGRETTGAGPMAEGSARLRSAAIWGLIGLTAAATAAMYLAVVRDLPPVTDGFRMPWWALALGFAATEVFVIHAHFRGSSHTLSLSELPLVVGLLLSSPQELIAAQIVGPIL